MRTRALHPVLLFLTVALVAGCGSDSDGFTNNTSNACNSESNPGVTTMTVTPTAVPIGGAAIAVEPVFTDLPIFTRPLAMLNAPGDSRCWFIVEQAGRVLAFENDDAATTTFPFVDIQDRVDDSGNEMGLLGMAFHPDYARNGQVFLSYTGRIGDQLTSFISRFTSDDDGITLNPDSEEVLLTVAQPFTNHNGGNIVFGPDGFLYIGFGDGGLANDPLENAQDNRDVLGAMLRIDVDNGTPYAIPADNPFADNSICDTGVGTTDCPEIFAFGLRNPWRWSFDRETGELWAGDVGQNALEEIDIIDSGGNYGWPFFEGTRCNTEAPVVDCSFVSLPPVTEYPRTDGQTVTGGYVYRGSEIPDLVGVYVYADFSSGNLFQYFDPGTGAVIEAKQSTGTPGLFISSFAEDLDGELYMTDLVRGTLHRIVAAP